MGYLVLHQRITADYLRNYDGLQLRLSLLSHRTCEAR
jgi:hypothetical protein